MSWSANIVAIIAVEMEDVLQRRVKEAREQQLANLQQIEFVDRAELLAISQHRQVVLLHASEISSH